MIWFTDIFTSSSWVIAGYTAWTWLRVRIAFQLTGGFAHFLPGHSSVTLQVGDALYVTIFINKIMQENTEFLSPFLFG